MKICLDAGHYGRYNQSPADKAYYESEMTWKLHLLQKKYLKEYGVKVITTRENQGTDRGLYARGAASKGCDLFISDHSNAIGNEINDHYDYPIALCMINGTADGIGMALAQCVETVMKTRQPARIEHRRGKNGDYYGVLRGAAAVGTPGLILEHSFHTNRESVRWLLDSGNLDRLAKEEARTIARYYNLIKEEPEKKSGWYEENGGWRFYLGNTGEPVRNDWYRDGHDWYWFNGNGMMVFNTWKIGADGKWYYLQENGSMAVNQWVIWKDELYRITEDGSMFEGRLCLKTAENGALTDEEGKIGQGGRMGRTSGFKKRERRADFTIQRKKEGKGKRRRKRKKKKQKI
ncbi:N-acetylmuramoyl-L-alanine amidase [Lachnospiraceae bacterium 62-35]